MNFSIKDRLYQGINKNSILTENCSQLFFLMSVEITVHTLTTNFLKLQADKDKLCLISVTLMS